MTQREHLKKLMRWLIANEALVHYGQVRPMPTIRLSEGDVKARFGRGQGITMDCSESVTVMCRWAGLRDPNGLGYNGAGYTGDELEYLSHDGNVGPGGNAAQAQVGDLVIFGPGSGDHVCMVLEPGVDPLLFSHGQERGPIAIRLTEEGRYHRAPTRFLDIGMLLTTHHDVWRGKGMWVWQGAKTDPEALCANLAKHGYRWITVKAQDGGSLFNPPELIGKYRDAARRNGLHFTIWGYLYAKATSPEDEAKLASELITRYGPEGYIADVEKEYEANPEPVSRRFVEAFRARRPDFPLAYCPFGRLDLHSGLDSQAWAAGGAAFMPQAYACENSELEPELCVRSGEPLWPRSEQYPTLGAYKGVRGRLPGTRLAGSISGLGVAGINLWDAQECTPDQLEADYGQWFEPEAATEEVDMPTQAPFINADGRFGIGHSTATESPGIGGSRRTGRGPPGPRWTARSPWSKSWRFNTPTGMARSSERPRVASLGTRGRERQTASG